MEIDLENWMGNLPGDIKKLPITQLAIPGTHDSMTYSITRNSPIAPDFEYRVKNCIGNLIGCFVSRWAKTQDYSSTEQLKCGIRYFDLRVSTRDGTNELYFVHGLYADEVWDVLRQINEFLDDHPSEVIIIDFNHFYAFDNKDHIKLINMIKDVFNMTKLIPVHNDMDVLNLAYLTSESKCQVFCIYRSSEIPAEERYLFWPSAYFPSPWPNTIDKKHLLDVLTRNLHRRNSKICYISQFILTPDLTFILRNSLSSLKKKCATPLNILQQEWLEKQRPGKGGLNIVITDFMNLSCCEFSKTIVTLNLNLLNST